MCNHLKLRLGIVAKVSILERFLIITLLDTDSKKYFYNTFFRNVLSYFESNDLSLTSVHTKKAQWAQNVIDTTYLYTQTAK